MTTPRTDTVCQTTQVDLGGNAPLEAVASVRAALIRYAEHARTLERELIAASGRLSDEQSRVNKALDDIRLACWYGLEEDIDSKEAMLKQIDKYARDAMEPQK